MGTYDLAIQGSTCVYAHMFNSAHTYYNIVTGSVKHEKILEANGLKKDVEEHGRKEG